MGALLLDDPAQFAWSGVVGDTSAEIRGVLCGARSRQRY